MALNFGAGWKFFGGDISIYISTDSVEVAKYLCVTAVTLGALYISHKLMVWTAVINGVGGERNDQNVEDIRPGSLHVLLRCLTDERFLEVLADYESGRMKESLEKEFSRVGIKVVGLKVKIENMVEVEETRKAINKRSLQMNKDLCEDVKKIEIDDPECDLEINVPGSSSGMNSSKEHINWITVGELINVIKKPVALYTTHIVERWHVILCKECQPFGHCRNPGTCQMKMKPGDLCPSCNGWYQELAKSHRNRDKRKIEWRKNCDTSKFSVDPWEVAKFFMPVLGGRNSSVIDAASTDLSSLLNVLTWMNDVAFAPDRRVDLNLVKDLRTVRNLWGHAPNQELTGDDFNNAFDIVNKFVADLDNVFSCDEVKKCIEDIKFAQTNKVSNVATEAELRALNSQRDLLRADVSQLKEEMKDEIEEMKGEKEDKSFDSQVIKEREKELERLVNTEQKCSTKINLFCQVKSL